MSCRERARMQLFQQIVEGQSGGELHLNTRWLDSHPLDTARCLQRAQVPHRVVYSPIARRDLKA